MRKILILFIFLSGAGGILFSQNIAITGNSSPFSSNSKANVDPKSEGGSDLLSYWDLGGHLFAGQYPINNPFNTGDTGIIYLYLVNDNQVIPVDTTQFSDFGYFVFPHVPEGKYLLKARLTDHSNRFTKFFPTYLTSSLRWNFSGFIELKDNSLYEANINLLPTVDSLTGPASIKGYVVQASSEQGVKVMSNAEVILFNEKMEPLTFCFSDINGKFFIPDLPYGTYNLIAESTGKFPAFLKITLDQNHTTFDSVLLEALSHNPSTIEVAGHPNEAVINPAFPNPAHDNVNMVVRTTEPEDLNFAIFSLNGKKILSIDYEVTGIRSVNIFIGSLESGTYLLMVSASSGQWREVQKFVKF